MASSGNGHHNEGIWVFPDPGSAARDLMGKISSRSGVFTLALAVAGILFVLGIIGFVAKASAWGFSDTAPWGYYMAIFSFVFMITASAPLVAVAFRFTKSHWRRPVSRVSELFAVVGVLNVVMFIPVMLALPPIQNVAYVAGEHGAMAARRSIWLGMSGVPLGAPHWWDMLGIVSLALAALVILWLSALPDMAQGRLLTTGFRRWVYTLLAGHWYGTKKQWLHQKAGLAILGGLYFMMLIFVEFLVVTDYAMSLVPGWKDSILPPLYTILGFQSCLGLILIILFIMRRFGGYGGYIGISPFWSASKILLGLTLLWTYHLFAFFVTFWYGRLEVEENIIRYFLFQSYSGVFWFQLLFTFFIPFFLMIWNPLRRSAWGPPLAGLSALGGCFLYNVRTFVGSFNVGEVYEPILTRVPPPVYPDPWDVLIVIGGLGAVAFIFLLAARLLPIMSIWETKEGAMYQHMDTLIRGEYLVLAKPE